MVKKESLGPDEASSHRHVTLDDVARAAGVSKWTVMRILQGKRKNSWRQKQDQARKIIELARQMGYRVNHAARAVRTRRHRTIALLQNLQEGESTINRLFFRGLLEGLDTAGYYLIMATLDKERASSGNMMPRPLSEDVADALLINYQEKLSATIERAIHHFHIPTVWINSDRDVDCVKPADRESLADLTRMLIKLGHRRIGYLDLPYHTAYRGHQRHYSREHRWFGYRDAMQESGLTPELWAPERPLSVADEYRYIEERLDRSPCVTAVIMGSDSPLFFLALQKRGIQIGRDLAVVTVDFRKELSSGMVLDSIEPPWFELGQLTVKVLQQKLAAPQLTPLPACTLALRHIRCGTVFPVSS